MTALETLGRAAAGFAKKAKAANTRKAYSADWDDFGHWCKRFGRTLLPASPETVALYLADCSERLKASTLQRRLATIAEAHKTAGLESPPGTPRCGWCGRHPPGEGGGPGPQKACVLTRHLKAMLAHLPDSPVGVRDRALLLLGYAGSMRRSELVSGRTWPTWRWPTRGWWWSSANRRPGRQAGVGRKVGIPLGANPDTRPVKSVQAWLEQSG
ncbi:MAG: site-specific integrase [Gemmataceae bacterium]